MPPSKRQRLNKKGKSKAKAAVEKKPAAKAPPPKRKQGKKARR